MFRKMYKVISLYTLNLLVAFPLHASLVEQKAINFPIRATDLLKGEVHYFFNILSPRKFAVQYPQLLDLDSLSLAQEENVVIVVNKAVYLVNKPVGFFDDKQLVDEGYVKFVNGDQKIKKTGPDSFKVIVPGDDGYSYKMKTFFDADDVSTLPNSKVIRAVNSVKQLDVISKSSSTIMFTEKTEFTKYTEGGVSVSSFIPMNERKTLVITYNLWAVQKPFAQTKKLKEAYKSEIEAVKRLHDRFK